MKEAILKQIRRFIRPFTKIKNIGKYPLVGWLYGLLIAIMNPITINGSKMYISRKDGLGLLVTPGHEHSETMIMKAVIGEGDTVIDIGAHIGYYALLMAKLVGDKGKVYAFEPDPDNFKLLLKNAEANGYDQLHPMNMAVSDSHGDQKLYLRGDGVSRRLWDNEGVKDYVMVKVNRLDSILYSDHYDLIKIDAEGCEARIIRGAMKTLEKTDRLIMEWRPADIRAMEDDPLKALETLETLGFTIYEIFEIEDDPIEIIDLKEICKDTIKTNLYCIKQ